MKTFDECLAEAENKYSRKGTGGFNVDCLYPILKQIVKEGTKTWLTQRRILAASIDERIYDPLARSYLQGVICELDKLLEELDKTEV
jgi:hypothetical protein